MVKFAANEEGTVTPTVGTASTGVGNTPAADTISCDTGYAVVATCAAKLNFNVTVNGVSGYCKKALAGSLNLRSCGECTPIASFYASVAYTVAASTNVITYDGCKTRTMPGITTGVRLWDPVKDQALACNAPYYYNVAAGT